MINIFSSNSCKSFIFPSKFVFCNGAIFQKSTVHLHPLHSPYAAPDQVHIYTFMKQFKYLALILYLIHSDSTLCNNRHEPAQCENKSKQFDEKNKKRLLVKRFFFCPYVFTTYVNKGQRKSVTQKNFTKLLLRSRATNKEKKMIVKFCKVGMYSDLQSSLFF